MSIRITGRDVANLLIFGEAHNAVAGPEEAAAANVGVRPRRLYPEYHVNSFAAALVRLATFNSDVWAHGKV
jgi:hypothetical protein